MKLKRASILLPVIGLLIVGAACSKSGNDSSLAPTSSSLLVGANTSFLSGPQASQQYGFLAQGTSNQQTGVWVTGQGIVNSKPDTSMVSLGVYTQANTVNAAMSSASDAMNKVIKSLKGNGVQDKDITTNQFSIQPIYGQATRPQDKPYPGYEQPVIVGYSVNNIVSVKIQALDKVGKIIDDAASAGGDSMRVQSISFRIENTDTLLKQARDLAIKDAQQRASQLVAGVGLKLGKAVYINENSYSLPSPVPYAVGARDSLQSAPTPISPGQQDVSATVQVVFEIE